MNADGRRWTILALLLAVHAALAMAPAAADGFESSIANEIGRRLLVDEQGDAITFEFPYSRDVIDDVPAVGAVEVDERSFCSQRSRTPYSAYRERLQDLRGRWTSIDFAFSFSRYISDKRLRRYFRHPLEPLYHGAARLEEPASLPQPTLVEHFIAKGFPSGELSRDASVRDDSYFLAEEACTIGGLRFSR